MKKNQTNRLSIQHKKSKGPKGIFGKSAQKHDVSVRDVSIFTFETLRKNFAQLEFRYRDRLKKSEINKKLNDVDARLGVTLFVGKSEIKPDGGIIEVKDKKGKWRIVLVSEAKHQGKDIENISKGVLVGKNKNQDTMVAGNAIERSHKNINEIRNIMVDETMAMQGSCWAMHKSWWEKIIGELQSEGYGTHYQDSHEMQFKTWQAGGKLMVDKNTWYAHKHRKFPRTHGYGGQPARDGFIYALKVWGDYYRKEIQPKWGV